MSQADLNKLCVNLMLILTSVDKERVNTLLESMSRDEVWYVRERAEELYSAAAYAFEQKED